MSTFVSVYSKFAFRCFCRLYGGCDGCEGLSQKADLRTLGILKIHKYSNSRKNCFELLEISGREEATFQNGDIKGTETEYEKKSGTVNATFCI